MSPDTLPGAPAAVLFDMDGTLVDTERLWWDAVEQVAARLGRPLSDADAPAVVGRPADHTAAHLCRALGRRRPTRMRLPASSTRRSRPWSPTTWFRVPACCRCSMNWSARGFPPRS